LKAERILIGYLQNVELSFVIFGTIDRLINTVFVIDA